MAQTVEELGIGGQRLTERELGWNRGIRDLHKIIDPKNGAAGYARRTIFGFYMNHFSLGVL